VYSTGAPYYQPLASRRVLLLVRLLNLLGRRRLASADKGAKKIAPMIDYIQKGGLLMWPILACSIIAIAVFLERFFYLHRATIHVGEFLKGLSNLVQRRNFAEALHESAGTPGPVARVIHSALLRHDMSRS